ncbi:MAG: arginine N-succinyltransferase, partial [Phycisphaerales bacterium]
VRFHWIGLHRKLFRPTILAELMAPITTEGDNLLWDYLGRRFIPLSYTEADRFCQHSREFMTSLLPEGDIHLSLLPPEARALVGEVGKETVPARKMLERLGFEYNGLVDPFDGGPYLTAKTNSIDIVRDTHASTFGKAVAHSRTDMAGIVSTLDSDGEFAAVQAAFALDRDGRVCVTKETMEALGIREGAVGGYTPMRVPVTPGRKPQRSLPQKTSKKKVSKKKKTTAKKSAKKTAAKKTAVKKTSGKKTTKKAGG